MAWRIEEEDINVVLKTRLVKNRRKFLASDEGYAIRNVMLVGDARKFNFEYTREGMSSTQWDFYGQTEKYPGEKRVTVILSELVYSIFRSGKNEQETADIITEIIAAVTEAFKEFPEFFNSWKLEPGERHTLGVIASAPSEARWTRFTSSGPACSATRK